MRPQLRLGFLQTVTATATVAAGSGTAMTTLAAAGAARKTSLSRSFSTSTHFSALATILQVTQQPWRQESVRCQRDFRAQAAAPKLTRNFTSCRLGWASRASARNEGQLAPCSLYSMGEKFLIFFSSTTHTHVGSNFTSTSILT